MKTDRELLELAAKAAGMEFFSFIDDPLYGTGMNSGEPDDGLWNPLTDDGDALRLAVKLSMRVYVVGTVETEIKFWCKSDYCYLTQGHSTDSAEATRRAIVRAAAAIGGRTP